jgi:hypothetical protein
MSRVTSRSTNAFAAAVVVAALASAGSAAMPATGSDGPAGCPEVGDTCADGALYAGVSPDTGNALFVTRRDASGFWRWKEGMEYAAELDAHGHTDWRLPSRAELHVLYQNRDKGALKGTFDESGGEFVGWYWSSTEHPDDAGAAWMERFSDGNRDWDWKVIDASVRPIRSEPRP